MAVLSEAVAAARSVLEAGEWVSGCRGLGVISWSMFSAASSLLVSNGLWLACVTKRHDWIHVYSVDLSLVANDILLDSDSDQSAESYQICTLCPLCNPKSRLGFPQT